MANIDELDLEKSLELLEECYNFLNFSVNKKYNSIKYKNSYELASEVGKFLRKTNDYDTRKK